MTSSHASRPAANPLLIKDEVGKQRASTYKLPGQDHRYGKPDIMDAEGAKEIINHWKSHDPSHALATSSAPADFQAINRAASVKGRQALVAASELKKTGKLVVHFPTPSSAAHASSAPVQASRVFGKPTRPSTPIADVVKNKFGLQGERAHAHRVSEISRARQEAKRELHVRPTKASDAHAKRPVGHQDATETVKEPFKMKKFLKVPPRLVLPGGNRVTATNN